MRSINLVIILAGLFWAVSAKSSDDFLIRRLRLVANPAPSHLAGTEVLEVNFGVKRSGWLFGFGWSLHCYDQGKNMIGQESRAYFLPGQTPVNRLAPGRIKGPGEYTAFFPVPEKAKTLLMVIGDPGRLTYRLLPSDVPVEEFKVSIPDLNREISQADYQFIRDLP